MIPAQFQKSLARAREEAMKRTLSLLMGTLFGVTTGEFERAGGLVGIETCQGPFNSSGHLSLLLHALRTYVFTQTPSLKPTKLTMVLNQSPPRSDSMFSVSKASLAFPPADVCVACLEAPPNVRLLPCGHQVSCNTCWSASERAGLPRRCFLCRTLVTTCNVVR